jgi:spermidine/putrescine transport system permease protein
VRSDTLARGFVLAFVAIFFLYLFGPLLIMSVTAFNSASFPRVAPFECFSVEWFNVLIRDNTLMLGLKNSLIIGAGVVVLAVPTGLAAALLLTQVSPRVRPWYYTIVISPILIPGVVLGLSTLVFWDRLGGMFNAGYDTFFYDGIFLSIIGQSTFVAAYSMLVFISRLQRFDAAQEEAALDLGATHVQTFTKVLLPFLKPAIASAAVLAFLASFENYNTTVFTIASDSTLTTVLASKVRYGINPSISALAVIIVVLTLVGAVVFEIMQRREAAAQAESELIARGKLETRSKRAALIAEPAMIILILVCIAGLGTVYLAGTIGVDECKTVVKAEKRKDTQKRVKARQTLEMFKGAAPSEDTGTGTATAPEIKAKGTEGYQSIFAPSTLEGMAGQESKQEEEEKVEAKGTEGYRNIFAPQNLEDQVDSDKKSN